MRKETIFPSNKPESRQNTLELKDFIKEISKLRGQIENLIYKKTGSGESKKLKTISYNEQHGFNEIDLAELSKILDEVVKKSEKNKFYFTLNSDLMEFIEKSPIPLSLQGNTMMNRANAEYKNTILGIIYKSEVFQKALEILGEIKKLGVDDVPLTVDDSGRVTARNDIQSGINQLNSYLRDLDKHLLVIQTGYTDLGSL